MGSEWDAAQYLKFEAQRTRPARDLAAGVGPLRVLCAVDIGCGPGNSTAVVANAFPGADVLGVDNSAEMLAAAAAKYPGLRFALCDASRDFSSLGDEFDLVFSNACLQWVPNHLALFPRLLALLRPGGRLAVQMPDNQGEPMQAILAALAAEDPWRAWLSGARPHHILSPAAYCDILAGAGAGAADIWRTTYYHILGGHADILEWFRSTGLRPFLSALPQERRAGFEAEVLRRVRAAYPAQADGRVLLPFPRLFIVAEKSG